jgi:uroporphyrinogen-III decarboxylase
VDAECKRILESGIAEGGRFILREANNLSPRTPVENVAAMYEAGTKYGRH